METKLKELIADENWEALNYLYEETSEELRLKFAFNFGKAYLLTQLPEGIRTDADVEKLTKAFRISLYDYRLTETIQEIIGDNSIRIMVKMDRLAWDHIQKSSSSDPGSADHSKYGSEYYLLMIYMYPDRGEVLKRTSKAAIFLLETYIALHINNICGKKESWRSLLDTIVRVKALDVKFIPAIIAFLRIYNSFRPTEKITQLSFMGYLLKNGEKFRRDEVESITAFVKELEKETIGILLRILKGEGENKEKGEADRISRAEELRQFAIDHANCPDNLDHNYFRETLTIKKVMDQVNNSNLEEAFRIFQNEFPVGLPVDAVLIRPLFTKTVSQLYQESGQIDCVVKALELDPANRELNELLLS